ncbi:DUF3843 family protein [Coprobacter tertius]|uniref:DUF3843 family protein n=1 Tax=Coprobacter tertius TaxID=2944915 RepID=A0ABT1MER4_9BACT|nr:DUF3843 family protein [Coprobacter tertius]MCP9610859.1 DUF3843 family protein [Coprobacter tertius]
MAKKKQVIFSGDWMGMHPYQSSAPTDLYYVKLANRIYEAADVLFLSEAYHKLYLDEDEKKRFCCTLTAYFEDIISQTGIFTAFTRECLKRTGKPLPFYTCEDYAEDEINTCDLQFIIWHFFMQLDETNIPYSPLDPLFTQLATTVMQILDAEYETAPENEKLKKFFLQPNLTSRNIENWFSRIFWTGSESYLFQENGLRLQIDADDTVDMAKKENMEDRIPEMINMLCNDFAYNNVTEFFALRPAQWLSRILGKSVPVYECLDSLSRKYSGYFRYIEEKETHTRFTHIATGKEIEITNRSLIGFPPEMKNENRILFFGIVKWDNDWWLVGEARSYDGSEELADEITGQEEEYHLFDEKEELPENEQEIILNDILTDTQDEEGEPLSPTEVAWIALKSDELGKSFFKNAYLNNRIPELAFEGENGKILIKENLDFMLDYIKR